MRTVINTLRILTAYYLHLLDSADAPTLTDYNNVIMHTNNY